MSRFWVILSALLPLPFAAAAEPEPEPAARPAVRWQYAELSRQQSGAVAAPDGTVTPGKMVFSWTTSSAKISAEGWEGLAKKLKAPEPGKDAEPNHKLRVLDRLGAQGWELVGVEQPPAPAAARAGARPATARQATTWLFRRRLDK